MTIDIVGLNSKECMELRKRVIKAVSKIDGPVTINLLDNDTKGPSLYINNHLVSKNKLLTEKELTKILKNNSKDKIDMV